MKEILRILFKTEFRSLSTLFINYALPLLFTSILFGLLAITTTFNTSIDLQDPKLEDKIVSSTLFDGKILLYASVYNESYTLSFLHDLFPDKEEQNIQFVFLKDYEEFFENEDSDL